MGLIYVINQSVYQRVYTRGLERYFLTKTNECPLILTNISLGHLNAEPDTRESVV